MSNVKKAYIIYFVFNLVFGTVCFFTGFSQFTVFKNNGNVFAIGFPLIAIYFLFAFFTLGIARVTHAWTTGGWLLNAVKIYSLIAGVVLIILAIVGLIIYL
jgi:hypothetical protein